MARSFYFSGLIFTDIKQFTYKKTGKCPDNRFPKQEFFGAAESLPQSKTFNQSLFYAELFFRMIFAMGFCMNNNTMYIFNRLNDPASKSRPFQHKCSGLISLTLPLCDQRHFSSEPKCFGADAQDGGSLKALVLVNVYHTDDLPYELRIKTFLCNFLR